jgi:hypothetical protein
MWIIQSFPLSFREFCMVLLFYGGDARFELDVPIGRFIIVA